MSSWPGAGAAITRVYEARQGANKEGMSSRRTGMTELTMVGSNILIITLWASPGPTFHLPLHDPAPGHWRLALSREEAFDGTVRPQEA